jgi:hypothetical protein
MTLGWITQLVHVGTRAYLSHLLYWQGWEQRKKRYAG